jgi:hypothetical protein
MAERPSSAAVAGALTDFDRWVVGEYRSGATSGFTALVILVRIRKKAVALQRSTYLHVIGEETGWSEVHALFSQSGARWDGAALFVKRRPEGGPLDDFSARLFLLDQQARVADDRLTINEGHFFDVWGRRMRIDEVAR